MAATASEKKALFFVSKLAMRVSVYNGRDPELVRNLIGIFVMVWSWQA